MYTHELIGMTYRLQFNSVKSKNLVAAQSHEAGVLLAFGICWNPEAGGSSASEGMDVIVRVMDNPFRLPLSLYRLPAAAVTQGKGVLQSQDPDDKCALHFLEFSSFQIQSG